MVHVDMVIKRIWLSGRKSRSVKTKKTAAGFGTSNLRWDSTPPVSRTEKTNALQEQIS